MKKIMFFCICFLSVGYLFSQDGVDVTNNKLYFENNLFMEDKTSLLELELFSGATLLPQPADPRIAILSMANRQRTGWIGIFVREPEGYWLQVVLYAPDKERISMTLHTAETFTLSVSKMGSARTQERHFVKTGTAEHRQWTETTKKN